MARDSGGAAWRGQTGRWAGPVTDERAKGGDGQTGSAGRTSTAVPIAADAENYYHLLGVAYGATTAEVTRAYRAAMKRTHPDRQRADRRGAAEETAKRLNLAYATLSRPQRRRAYDQTIRTSIVQDEIMGRYVGGFYVPQGGGADATAPLRRSVPTPAERRERAQADRTALVTMVAVFGGLAAVLIGGLLVWAVVSAVAGRLF